MLFGKFANCKHQLTYLWSAVTSDTQCLFSQASANLSYFQFACWKLVLHRNGRPRKENEISTVKCLAQRCSKAAQILAVPTAQLTVAQRHELFGLKIALESERSLIADLGKEIETLIEDDDASEAEMAESSENLDSITQTILLITRVLTEADQPMANVNQAPQSMQDERRQTRQGFQLPKMNIPIFSGEYLQWNSFCDLFNASVHSNETLTDAQRLQYLKASLKEDGAKIISHLTITDANYAEARNALQTRYVNLRLIVRSHIRPMLEVPVMKGETAREMRNLLETFREHMQVLETFGLPVHQWDATLVYHISQMLVSESRKAWELAHAGNDLQTIQQMTDFLSERCSALESSSAKLKSVLLAETKTVNSANKGSNARRGYGHTQSGPKRGQAYGASFRETNICQICQGNHKVMSRNYIPRCCCSSRPGEAKAVFQLSTIISHDQSMPKQVSLPNLSWKASFLDSPTKAEY